MRDENCLIAMIASLVTYGSGDVLGWLGNNGPKAERIFFSPDWKGGHQSTEENNASGNACAKPHWCRIQSG